ncbi:MAG: DUF4145 domain-containing protein [Candidatus Brocadiales bacterium]|nr:DUF4145 domain-containing protein [Candidatus Bathyanammoxibius sp.]
MKLDWQNRASLPPKDYVCGHCAKDINSRVGYLALSGASGIGACVYLCHRCGRPTFFDVDDKQYPGAKFGYSVEGIGDESVEKLYEEARNCVAANAFTGAVLCCRKLLMNIAVSKGAKEEKNFIKYVEYLSEKNYIPPDAKQWVDHIRKMGNEATHDIRIISKHEAEELLSFMGILLKVIFEFPAAIRQEDPAQQ